MKKRYAKNLFIKSDKKLENNVVVFFYVRSLTVKLPIAAYLLWIVASVFA